MRDVKPVVNIQIAPSDAIGTPSIDMERRNLLKRSTAAALAWASLDKQRRLQRDPDCINKTIMGRRRNQTEDLIRDRFGTLPDTDDRDIFLRLWAMALGLSSLGGHDDARPRSRSSSLGRASAPRLGLT